MFFPAPFQIRELHPLVSHPGMHFCGLNICTSPIPHSTAKRTGMELGQAQNLGFSLNRSHHQKTKPLSLTAHLIPSSAQATGSKRRGGGEDSAPVVPFLVTVPSLTQLQSHLLQKACLLSSPTSVTPLCFIPFHSSFIFTIGVTNS